MRLLKVKGKINGIGSINFKPITFVIIFVVILATSLISCKSSESSNPAALKKQVSCCIISPDNKTLLFNYYTPVGPKTATYDIATGKIQTFKDEVNKVNDGAMYSPNGTKISYLCSRQINEPLDVYIMNADGTNRRQITKGVHALGAAFFSPDGNKLAFLGRMNSNESFNLFTVNVDGTNLRQITTDQNVKGVPSFSPDGKKIIYKKSHLRRQRALPLKGEMDTAWDIYEYDLENGVERRLTNYNFYKAYNPRYMSDGKRFTFSAEGPVNSKGSGPKDFEEYEKKYQKNFIFIMDGINNELKPAFTYGDNSISCYHSNDDSLLFLSEIHGKNDRKTTQELFLYKDGKIKRITNLNSYVVRGSLSPDNSIVNFTDLKNKEAKHWLINIDSTGLEEVLIPQDELK